MTANDDLVLKDKGLDRIYKQIQFDFENKKITDKVYVKELRELHIKLLVHLEEVKNYRDSDSRLTPIKSLEERSEHIKKKINQIIDKYYPKTVEQKKIEGEILEFADKMDKERVVDIFTVNKKNSRQFGLKLTSGDSALIDFDNQFTPLSFSDSAFSILEDIIVKNKIILKDWANLYKEHHRDFDFFIYDLASHAYFLDKLPKKFQKLRTFDGSYENLLHDRVISQLAVQYQKQGCSIDYEVLNSKGKNPDLHVNSSDLEVKTIVSEGINHPDHFVRFSKSVRNRFQEACAQIYLEKDMIVIAPWSQIMLNTLKAYYRGMFSKTLPQFKEGKTILLLEGDDPFEDYYLEFPSNEICNSIREFSESGYKRVSAMSYLGSVRRKGFVITRSGNARQGFGFSYRFT